MINDNEVREALNDLPAGANIPKKYCKAVNTLIDLAESYLKAGKEMPKQEIHECSRDCMQTVTCVSTIKNKVIQNCTFAYMKREAEREKKLDILKEMYSTKIFTDLTDEQLSKIHNFCLETLKIPLDRLSAFYMRLSLDSIRGYLGGVK